jgi:hypothetical protein
MYKHKGWSPNFLCQQNYEVVVCAAAAAPAVTDPAVVAVPVASVDVEVVEPGPLNNGVTLKVVDANASDVNFSSPKSGQTSPVWQEHQTNI